MPNSSDIGVTLSLSNQVALITGGSRGIGAATVRLFRQAGARVAFSYRSQRAQADAIAAECGERLHGGDLHGHAICLGLRQELSTPEDGHALVAAAVQAFGRLDCLIVNHGVWPPHDAPIATMTPAQWRSTLGTNLDSVFGLVQAAVAQMQSQATLQSPSQSQARLQHAPPPGSSTPRGHIVLVSSTAAQRGEAFHADYAASKGALISLTKSLSSELAGTGIACNCVAPGWVDTEMSAAALADPDTSKKIMAAIPLGRPAHVDEIAGPILFLCTPLAGFVSGEVFNVNGGAVLAG